jgi:WASH complex subunit strumpellin
VNITDTVLSDINTVSDFSFAWEIMRDFVGDMHDRIKGDPASVRLMRATFLKLTSVLDVPLVRIQEARSEDTLSVAEYYSGELVAFLRTVMEIIPVIVFAILRDVISLQSKDMRGLPPRFELIQLKDFAQLAPRHQLARRTHEISVFTEGILAMEKTLLGVIKVDPRQILNDGVRKHLVDRISRELHSQLVFDTRGGRGRDPKASLEGALAAVRSALDGFRRGFEYVQDYIGVYALRMWQEEFTRIIGFNTEQECNKYVRRRVLPSTSKYQSKAIPLPLFLVQPPADTTVGTITFMGRVVDALTSLTSPARTIYGPGPLGGGWYEPTGREVAGLGLFSMLSAAVGVPGLMGVDRLLGFGIERELGRIMRLHGAEVRAGGEVFQRLAADLEPTAASYPAVIKAHPALAKKMARPLDLMVDGLCVVGQGQLLRRVVAHELRFGCRLDSNLLCGALEALNTAVVSDIRRHYTAADEFPMPDASNQLLPQLARYTAAAGIDDPLTNIYVTHEQQPFVGLFLTLLAIGVAPRLVYDREFGCLVRRKATDPVDGAPLVAGIVTLLKQLHPSVTDDWLGYMGQYVNATVAAALPAPGTPAAVKTPATAPADTVTLLLLVQHVCSVARIPDRVRHAHVPAYLFDSLVPAKE